MYKWSHDQTVKAPLDVHVRDQVRVQYLQSYARSSVEREENVNMTNGAMFTYQNYRLKYFVLSLLLYTL